jgi:hypothetical protein
MAGMDNGSGHDPLAKSRYEANRFNVAWMRDGERLNWVQRIGFATISLVTFFMGLIWGALAVNDVRKGSLIGAFGWSIACLIFIVPGSLGLRNVLRF